MKQSVHRNMHRLGVLATVALVAACGDGGGPVEILDNAALSLLDENATITVQAEGFLWTEGPLWVEEGGYLLFSDIPNNVVHKFVPGEGVEVFLEPSGATGLDDGNSSQGSNGLLLSDDDRLVLMQQGDRRVAYMNAALTAPNPDFVTLAASYNGKRLNSPNDGVFHSDGSLYFTDPPYGLESGIDDEGKELSFQGIFRLRADGEVELLDDSVSFPNGIGLSIDEKTLYVAVSDDRQPMWLAYDVLPAGALDNKRVFYDASHFVGVDGEQGLPDGMAVHSSGTVFATGPGGVWLFTSDGEVLAKIRTGRKTANCTLSADEKTLFVTAHDTLMTVSLR